MENKTLITYNIRISDANAHAAYGKLSDAELNPFYMRMTHQRTPQLCVWVDSTSPLFTTAKAFQFDAQFNRGEGGRK